MLNTRAANRYAKAILEIANSKKLASNVSADMLLIATTIKSNLELRSFIENPLIKIGAKNNVVSEIFVSVNFVTKNLFRLLLENKRFEILESIAIEYNKLFDIQNEVEVVKITTAIVTNKSLEEKFLNKIATFSSSKKIIIQNTVDPSIIGGFILKMGDKEYNASISNRLQVLKRELSN